MFTDKQLEQFAKVIDTRLDAKLQSINKRLEGMEQGQKGLKEQLNTVELKVEAIHAQNKKVHAEIMEKLTASNEIDGQELKKLEKRVETIEEHVGLSRKN